METNIKFIQTHWKYQYATYILYNNIGMVKIYIYKDKPNEGYISELFVDERYRGKKIATTLILTALSELLKRGCDTFALWLDKDDLYLKPWYEKFGFQYTKDKTTFTENDSIWMVRRLENN